MYLIYAVLSIFIYSTSFAGIEDVFSLKKGTQGNNKSFDNNEASGVTPVCVSVISKEIDSFPILENQDKIAHTVISQENNSDKDAPLYILPFEGNLPCIEQVAYSKTPHFFRSNYNYFLINSLGSEEELEESYHQIILDNLNETEKAICKIDYQQWGFLDIADTFS